MADNATSTNVVRGDLGAFYASVDDVTAGSSYPAGGYTPPSSIGISTPFLASLQVGNNSTAAGYLMLFDTTTAKFRVYESPAITPAGSLTVTVTGSQSAGAALQISTPSAAGVLGITNATAPLTIPGSTFGIAFTGTAGSKAVLAEVTTAASLAGCTFRMLTLGF